MSAIRYVAEVVVTLDAQRRVLAPGAVEIDGGVISWVGEPSAPPAEDTMVNDVGGLLLPGLINAHAHSAMTLLRSAGDGLPLERWLREVIWPREAHLTVDDVYWGASLGFHELLSCGVTATCETYLLDRGVVDAACDSGIRCVVTPGILDVPGAGEERRWPHFLEQALALHEAADGREGRVTVGLGPHSAYVVPEEGLVACAEAARALDRLLHLHVAETSGEGEEIRRRRGTSVPRLLEDLGVLEGTRCLAAHSVWLDDEDLDLFARREVAVAHCPGSNGKLGSGVARLAAMLERGITVGLGTDGPASNDDLDLWQEVRLAPLMARASSADATAVSSLDALGLATTGGAAALGIEAGSLAPGRHADLVRLELDDDRFVPGLDTNQLLSHLVWTADRSLVTDVWVGGRQVVAKGSCRTVDAPRTRREVRSRARRLVTEAG